jgi:capsid protein
MGMLARVRSWINGDTPALKAPAAPANATAKPAMRGLYENALWNSQNIRQWWLADYWSAKSANNFQTRRLLRMRSRQELSNNPILFGVCCDNANHLIGTGPTLQVDTGRQEYDDAIEKAWIEWCDEVDFTSKVTTLKLAKTVDGEGFIVMKTAKSMECPVKLYPADIEADQVTTPAPTNLMDLWVDGLTLDPVTGQPTSYHVLRHHPGDWYFPDLNPMSVQVISKPYVVHWFKKFRPGQVRGIPVFTPSLDLWTELRSFRKAVVAAANLGADYAAVLETPAPAGVDPQDVNQEYEPFDKVPIDRGMQAMLPAGFKMNQFRSEQPQTTYEVFSYCCIAESCRPLSFPLLLALGTAQKFNFSSAKLDHTNYRSTLDIERRDCEQVALNPIFKQWFLEALLVPGYLPRGLAEFLQGKGMKVPQHQWHWPGYASLDPVADTKANSERLSTGQITWQKFLGGEGIDWRQHFDQLKEAQDRIDELGLVLGEPPKLTIDEEEPDFLEHEGEVDPQSEEKRRDPVRRNKRPRTNTGRGHHKKGQYSAAVEVEA